MKWNKTGKSIENSTFVQYMIWRDIKWQTLILKPEMKIYREWEHCGDTHMPKTLYKENPKKTMASKMNGNVSLSFTVFIWVLRAKFVCIMHFPMFSITNVYIPYISSIYSFSFSFYLVSPQQQKKQFIVCCIWLFATLRVRFVFRLSGVFVF